MEALCLADYVTSVERVLNDAHCVEDAIGAIVDLKRRLLLSPGLVLPRFLEGIEKVPYTRSLLHADPAGRFTVLALVWAPGKESPVHDHESWGVVGAYQSSIDVVDFAPPGTDGALHECSRTCANSGEVIAILPPRTHNIHRMSNVGASTPAFTIHTYGDPATLCRVYDPTDGRHFDRPLRFHHAL